MGAPWLLPSSGPRLLNLQMCCVLHVDFFLPLAPWLILGVGSHLIVTKKKSSLLTFRHTDTQNY